MPQVHNTFISFHHTDERYRSDFETTFADLYHIFISKAVSFGDIEPNLNTDTIRRRIREEYLRDSTVTVVLVGPETWKRKHVDWEISASIRETRLSPRSGLLGILLPNYPRASMNKYDSFTIPPRLHGNVKCGYAKVYNWSKDPETRE